jgi:hypothetical protein
MTAAQIRKAVDRGLEIVALKKALDSELKAIEADLQAAGLRGDQEALKDADREGRRYLAKGSECVVPVVFTADLLVKSFAPDSDTHARIASAAAGKLTSFFALVPTYETVFADGKIFRAQADSILGPSAPAFLAACRQLGKGGIPKSQVKVEWNSAEKIPA